MDSIKTQIYPNWFIKFIISFLAIVGSANAMLTFLPLLSDKIEKQYIVIVAFSTLIISFLITIIFSIYWHRKERKASIDSEKCNVWFIAIMRYWLAFQMTIYAFVKFFKTQFGVSFHRNDALMGLLNGTDLTWGYFGYSYTLSVIIGAFQLLGAIFLLFRRTTLLGVAILLPIMFNIVLINFFYLSGINTLISSLLITITLSYLLILRRNDIIALFWNDNITSRKIGNSTLRMLSRISSILLAALFVIYFTYNDVKSPTKLLGKWKIESMIRNRKIVADNAWKKDPLAWKNIYFEERHEIYYCPNPYLYDDNRSLLMKYDYDEKNNALNVISYESKVPDTIPIQIRMSKDKSMSWDMVLHKDTIKMQLKKVSP